MITCFSLSISSLYQFPLAKSFEFLVSPLVQRVLRVNDGRNASRRPAHLVEGALWLVESWRGPMGVRQNARTRRKVESAMKRRWDLWRFSIKTAPKFLIFLACPLPTRTIFIWGFHTFITILEQCWSFELIPLESSRPIVYLILRLSYLKSFETPSTRSDSF